MSSTSQDHANFTSPVSLVAHEYPGHHRAALTSWHAPPVIAPETRSDRHAAPCHFLDSPGELPAVLFQNRKLDLCRPKLRSCTRFWSLTPMGCSAPSLKASCHSCRGHSPLRKSSQRCCISSTADLRDVDLQWAPVPKTGPRGPWRTAAKHAKPRQHLLCALIASRYFRATSLLPRMIKTSFISPQPPSHRPHLHF